MQKSSKILDIFLNKNSSTLSYWIGVFFILIGIIIIAR